MDRWTGRGYTCPTMQPAELAASLKRILEHTPAFPGDSLVVDLIANPRAGGFTRRVYTRARFAELATVEGQALALPLRPAPAEVRLHLTERSGHAADIAKGIIADAKRDGPGSRRILVTAGGDGTALEVASSLVDLPPEEAAHFALLRLPFGTGNDGSEGRDLVTALGRFLGPLAFAKREALLVTPNPEGGKAPLYSFNIASLGLDAFVCEMTNRLKTFFPGDFYKLWVDVASVFYEMAWPLEPLVARAFDAQGRDLGTMDGRFLLFAMGVSGHRTYGSNKHILPDDDNVCAVYKMSLANKLKFKEVVQAGGHRGLDILRLFSARRIVFDYPEALLLQCDGEVTRLGKSDFPLVMEVTKPLYNVPEKV